MSTPSHRRQGRKDDILRVFAQKVAAQGYDATSLSEMAEQLELSKGTIMHHYGSKDRMLQKMSLGYMERRLSELAIIRASFDDPVQQLAALITSLMTAFRDDYHTTRAFSREFARFADDPVMDDVRQMRKRYTNQVQSIIEEGISTGDIMCELPKFATLQIIGMCNWSWTWIEPSGSTPIEDIAAAYVANTLRGLSVKDRDSFSVVLPDEIVTTRKLNAS